MEIEDIEKFERKLGTASTVKADDIIPIYIERIGKFLRDNQGEMGDPWVENTAEKLYIFERSEKDGDLVRSNIDAGIALATFLPEFPLIAGQQLLSLYKQAGNKNPFGDVYIDFGIQINGKPETNPVQMKAILDELSSRGIKEKEGIINFSKLRLKTHELGLKYVLSEDFNVEDVEPVSIYPFNKNYIGKNGLFRACLYGGSDWDAYDDGLSDSDDVGRVVRYDTEGVVPKKLPQIKNKVDLVQKLNDNFSERFLEKSL